MILTEEIIAGIGQELAAQNIVSDITFARAIEAAVLAKLREQSDAASKLLLEQVDTLLAHVNGAHLSKSKDWENAHWESADRVLEKIQSVIKSLAVPQPVPSVPDGYQLVPVEPTNKMWFAGVIIKGDIAASYKAMLAAAKEKR